MFIESAYALKFLLHLFSKYRTVLSTVVLSTLLAAVFNVLVFKVDVAEVEPLRCRLWFIGLVFAKYF